MIKSIDAFDLMAQLRAIFPVTCTVAIMPDIAFNRLRCQYEWRHTKEFKRIRFTILREELHRLGLDAWIEKMRPIVRKWHKNVVTKKGVQASQAWNDRMDALGAERGTWAELNRVLDGAERGSKEELNGIS